jgi:glycerophosphoryl diester phosphodiesterase
VFAHRGGRALAPENTLVAFDRGMAAGADGLELDVHLSRDGEVVVCHDPTLERTTEASGPLRNFTAEQLARLDAGYWFPGDDGSYPCRGQGLGIPRLSEVLVRYPSIPLIVEMKDDEEELATATVEAVRRAGAGHRTCLGSFALGPLRRARRLAPEIATSAATNEVRVALVASWLGLFPRRPPYRALQVPEGRGFLRVITPRFVRAARGAGLPVQVWVVNGEADMRRLLGWGVDGLITDRPDLAARVLRESPDRAVPERP